MALIVCPECKGKISEYAESCPHCGCPMKVIRQIFAKLQKSTVAPVPSERKRDDLVTERESANPETKNAEIKNASIDSGKVEKGSFRFTKDEFNVIAIYGVTLHYLKKMLREGIINTDEYLHMEEIFKEKYKSPYAHLMFAMSREELDKIAGIDKKPKE